MLSEGYYADKQLANLLGSMDIVIPISLINQAALLSLRGASATKQSQETIWMNGQYYVYIMSNIRNTAVYTGVTNNLKRRVYEHKEKLIDGFTKKYNITKLVYYEVFEDIENAILREKQIKSGSRQKKNNLINSVNKEWRDLYEKF